jgi:hypothetical protein
MTRPDDADDVSELDLFCDVYTEERGIDPQALEQTPRLPPGPVAR